MRISNPKKLYHDNGNILRKDWYNTDNKRHRINKPAVIWYHENGDVASEEWWENGEQHRIGGPAIIWYHEVGRPSELWYVNGIKLTDKQIKVIQRKLKLEIINNHLSDNKRINIKVLIINILNEFKSVFFLMKYFKNNFFIQ